MLSLRWLNRIYSWSTSVTRPDRRLSAQTHYRGLVDRWTTKCTCHYGKLTPLYAPPRVIHLLLYLLSTTCLSNLVPIMNVFISVFDQWRIVDIMIGPVLGLILCRAVLYLASQPKFVQKVFSKYEVTFRTYFVQQLLELWSKVESERILF